MVESQRQYRTLILAGLLHDVGKLLNKPHGGPHPEIGESFLRRSPYAELLQDEKFAKDLDFELLCYLVRWHAPYGGNPSSSEEYQSLQSRISDADRLSSGERSWEKIPRGEWKDAGTRALDTVFSSLELGRPVTDSRPKYRPAPLHPKVTFPQVSVEPLSEADYRDVIQGFEVGFEHALRHAQNWAELEAWTYSLLERYTWVIPSDVRRERPEVSLFDHARTSCAIAAALYIRNRPEFADVRPSRSTFLLIQGDISGVQEYIYGVTNIGPGGVAKRLRARSFFVTALTEVIAHRLRDEMVNGYPLPIAAQIFAGGGQFVILAPDLPSVRDNLVKIRREVNLWLWAEFQGDLALVAELLPITQGQLDIEDGDICQALDELKRRVETAKQRRLGDLLQDERGWQLTAFKWEDKPYPHGDCPSCRRLPAQAGEGAPVDERLCPRCYRDRLLSERIVGARYIAYFRGSQPPASKDRTLTFFDNGEDEVIRHVVLLDDLSDLDRLNGRPYQLDGFGYELPTPEGPALVRHFANHVPMWQERKDLETFCTPGRGCVQGSYNDDETCGILVRPDGSRVQPDDFPILQTFGCISAAAAEWPDGSLGSQLLGVLRADVDNLGKLFLYGLEEVKSLSRLATLSRMVDLFFSGWVNETLAHPPPGKRYDRIYTVYSGGDDLCLVGPWDALIDFARHMACKFERYVAGNPNVTLSAAITVTKPKFPIATSARKAGEMLAAAKHVGRNRFNLFGVTARWRDLPPYENLSPGLAEQLAVQERHADWLVADLWDWAERLDQQLSLYRAEKDQGRHYPIAPAFAHRLLHHAEMARAWEQAGEIKADDMLYMARLAYDLGRNVAKSDAVCGEIKERLATLTQLQNRQLMAGMRLPITYALYRNRERSVKDGS